MIRVAALVAGVVLLASGCGGGGTATSAADIAPADVRAFISIPPQPEQPLTRRALRLQQSGLGVQALLDRAQWTRAAGVRVQVAELPDRRLVAYARLKDTKPLDAAGLAHVEARGWTVFAPTKAALDAARSKQHLGGTAWFAAASAAAGTSGTTLVAPGWVAFAAEDGTARRIEPGRGHDAPQRLADDIPADAVAVAASPDAARILRTLPLDKEVRQLIGLRLSDLARATPGSAVLYARPGLPVPSVTLLAEDGPLAAAKRVVHELAPDAQPAVREDVNGLALWHVALGAVDLYYGRAGRTLVISNDPRVALGGSTLEPPGLPKSSSGWLYVDVAHARPALAALSLLGGLGSTLGRFDRTFSGLSSALSYTTHEQGHEILTVVLR